MRDITDIDYDHHPLKELGELLDMYGPNTVLVLDDVLANVRNWSIIYQDILDIMKYGFERDEIRKRKIRFKFHEEDEKVYSLQLNHFHSNMILWKAFVIIDAIDILDESFVFDFRLKKINDIAEYINEKIIDECEVDFHTMNKVVDEIWYHVTAIARAFCLLMGMSASIYDIYRSANMVPEIDDLLHTTLPQDIQPVDAEKILTAKTDRLMELMSEVEGSDFRPLLLAGKNINSNQLKEIAIMLGFKADANGHTISTLMDSNIMVTGIHKPSHYYIVAQSGRKAMMLTKIAITKPGLLSKRLNGNTTGIILRKDNEMCDSVGYVEYFIKDEKYLSYLDKRYYYDEKGAMHLLETKNPESKELIGKVIRFRSPTTCNSKDGICRYCYGELFDMNSDLFSAGALASVVSSMPLGQKMLSSKHSQETHSDPITFAPEFDENFSLVTNQITINNEAEVDDDLFVQLGEVFTEESEDVIFYYIREFKVIDSNNACRYHIAEEHGSKMYLTDQILSIYKKPQYKNTPIPFDEFDDASVLFTLEIKNEELDETFRSLNSLLDTKDMLGCKTYNDLVIKMADIMMDGGIANNFVHNEMIIRGMLRKKSNLHEFPDFGKDRDVNDIQIMRVGGALIDSASPLLSLTAKYLKKQLLSPEFTKKNAPSYIDPLFIPQLSSIIELD